MPCVPRAIARSQALIQASSSAVSAERRSRTLLGRDRRRRPRRDAGGRRYPENDAEYHGRARHRTPARHGRERPRPRRRRNGGSAALLRRRPPDLPVSPTIAVSGSSHLDGSMRASTSPDNSADGRADDSGGGTKRRREPSRNNGAAYPRLSAWRRRTRPAEAVRFRAGGVVSCVVSPRDAHRVASVRRRWRHPGVAVEVAAWGRSVAATCEACQWICQ